MLGGCHPTDQRPKAVPRYGQWFWRAVPRRLGSGAVHDQRPGRRRGRGRGLGAGRALARGQAQLGGRARPHAQVPPPVQAIYKEIKSKIAGPHSVVARVATGQIAISTAGLNVLHKFFPTPEEIEAHPEYSAEGGDSDDEGW